MAGKLISALKKHDIVFIAIPAKAYESRFLTLAVEVADAFGSTCVVSLDTPACQLAKKLKAAGAPEAKILVVGVKGVAKDAKCVRGESSADCDGSIVDLTMALYRLVDTKKPNAVIMGPMSLLGKKNGKMDALKFISYVADDSRKGKRKFVVVCTSEDLSGECLKDVSLFVDKVLEEK